MGKNSYGTSYDIDDETFVNHDMDPDEYWGVVFAGDKKGLDAAFGSIRYHVGEKLGKSLTDVTLDDIREHGLLAVIDSEEYSDWQQHPDHDDPGYQEYEYEYNPPPSVEPGDYWTRDGAIPKKIVTGNGIIKLMRRYGALHDVPASADDEELKNIQKGQKTARSLNEV